MKCLWLIFLVGIVACGSDSSGSSSIETVLEGVWRTDCKDVGDGLFLIQTESFVGNQNYTNTVFYADPSCNRASFKFFDVYEFSITGKSPFVDALNIDYEAISLLGVAITENDAQDLNAESTFGYNDWKAGEPKDLSGRITNARGETIHAGGREYGIVKIENDTLYLGDPHTKDTTVQQRPTAVLMQVPFRKQ